VSSKLTRRASALAGAAACVWLAVPTTAADPLPADLSAQVIAGDIDYLQKALAKTPEKRALPTIKAGALILAYHAQANLGGAKGDEMAALRDQAVKVAEAVAKKDYAAAKTLAEGLKSAKGGEKKEVALHTLAKIDIAEIMSTFRKSTVGGRNYEDDLKTMAKKGVTDVKLAGRVAGAAYAISDFAAKLPPTGLNDAKMKQWNDFVKDMAAVGKDFAAEAGKGDGADKKKLGAIAQKMDKNCVDCHAVFKD
jgi:hypothetical protein